MATAASYTQGIKNSWTLIAFAQNKRIQVAPFTNGATGETFKSLVFTPNDGSPRQLVAFSSKLGELTPQQIASMKHELQVVQLESDNFKLCRQGADTWEEVVL